MRGVIIGIKKFSIFCHRWMGVAFCLLFMWWFISGIFMMYWSYPEVTELDRLERAPVLDPAKVKLSPEEAAKAAQLDSPNGVTLGSFDGRPAYFFRAGRGTATVYADTGEQQDIFTDEMNLRTVARWTGQPAESATVETVSEPDQWTLLSGLRRALPLKKYTFADGQHVYLSEDTGEVVQYTTTASRIYAHLGAIPHWLYYTPLKTQQKLWTDVVIWSSGIATIAATLGMIVGIWMLSPGRKYRHEGAPTMFPYKGQKRLHTILGLYFGILTMTWAFSGMMSMDPFPVASGGPIGGAKGKAKGKGQQSPAARVQGALAGGRVNLTDYASKHPREVLSRMDAMFQPKELDYTTFAGEPVFHVTNGVGETRVIPVDAEKASGLNRERVLQVVRDAAGDANIAETTWMEQYDLYYLDRTHQRPLPVWRVALRDEGHTRIYVDPATARVVGRYTESTAAWVNRWLYHGLHSLDFPWLYNYRPAWDIVVLALMLSCVWLCWTSIVLAWRVVKKKFVRQKTEVAV